MCLGLSTLVCLSASAATDCKALNREGLDSGDSIAGCDNGRVVIGSGRLQFYSAPDEQCKMTGTFIIPGDKVISYAEHKGYTSVMYINPKTLEDALGWVDSSRLERTGTGMSLCN